MKKTFSLLCLLICLNAHSQISQRCPVCPPSLNGVTDGWCLVDSAGKAVWQPCGASALTASQGLNKVGSDVRLGGVLNRGDVKIKTNGFGFYVADDTTLGDVNIGVTLSPSFDLSLIGKASISHLTDVFGVLDTSGNGMFLLDATNQIYEFGDITGGYNNTFFHIEDQNRLMYMSADNVGIGTASPTHTLEVGSASSTATFLQYIGNDGNDFVVYHYPSDNNAFRINGADKKIIFDQGADGWDLGIGVSNPNATLDVVGDLQFTTGNQGAGKVLTSDASGFADWSENRGLPLDTIQGATGGSGQLLANTYNAIDGSGTFVTYEIVFPASPLDGDMVEVKFERPVTTLTVNGNGSTVSGSITSAVLGAYYKWKYFASNATWY